MWFRTKPRVLLFSFFSSYPFCQTVLHALLISWISRSRIWPFPVSQVPITFIPHLVPGRPSSLASLPHCGLSSTGNTTSRVKPLYQSILSHSQSTQEPHLTQAHIDCTVTAVAWSPLLSPLCTALPPQSCWLTLPQHRRPHPVPLCFLSTSSQRPSNLPTEAFEREPGALSPQPCYPASCFFLPRTHCLATH